MFGQLLERVRRATAHGTRLPGSRPLDAMNEALKIVGQSGDEMCLVSKLLMFGEIRHQIYDEDDEPIRLWEEALSRLSTASTVIRRQWAREKIIYTNSIAQVYFDVGVQNYKGECNSVCRLTCH